MNAPSLVSYSHISKLKEHLIKQMVLMDEHHVGEEAIWEKVKQDGLVEMHTCPRNLSDAERACRRKVAGMKCYNISTKKHILSAKNNHLPNSPLPLPPSKH